eukprot:5467858-Pyramimonas_sp.AAC.1
MYECVSIGQSYTPLGREMRERSVVRWPVRAAKLLVYADYGRNCAGTYSSSGCRSGYGGDVGLPEAAETRDPAVGAEQPRRHVNPREPRREQAGGVDPEPDAPRPGEPDEAVPPTVGSFGRRRWEPSQ